MKLHWCIRKPQKLSAIQQKMFEICSNYVPSKDLIVFEGDHDTKPFNKVANDDYLCILDFKCLLKDSRFDKNFIYGVPLELPYYNLERIGSGYPIIIIQKRIFHKKDSFGWDVFARIWDKWEKQQVIILQEKCVETIVNNLDRPYRKLHLTQKKLQPYYNNSVRDNITNNFSFFNNEPMFTEKIDEVYDNLIVPCSGMIENIIYNRLHSKPKNIIHYDLSDTAIFYKKHMYKKEWVSIIDVINQLTSRKSDHLINLSSWPDPDHVEKQFQSILASSGFRIHRWKYTWDLYCQQQHTFLKVDLSKNAELLLPASKTKSSLFILNDLFYSEYFYWKYTREERQELFLKFIEQFINYNVTFFGNDPFLKEIRFKTAKEILTN